MVLAEKNGTHGLNYYSETIILIIFQINFVVVIINHHSETMQATKSLITKTAVETHGEIFSES